MNIIIPLVLTCCLFLLGCSSPKVPESKELQLDDYSVLMISIDTLRQDRLSAYGYPQNTSPFLDRLSKQSVFFSNVSAQSPKTNSSHLSLFTSQYVHRLQTDRIKSSETLAGILSSQGRNTAAIVAGGLMSRRFGLNIGFSSFDDRPARCSKILAKGRGWLQKNQKAPGFLFLHTYEVHSPFNPPLKFVKMFIPNCTGRNELHTMNSPLLNKLNLPPEKIHYVSRLYDAGIRYTDTLLYRFFKFLRLNGHLDRTILIILSDHGESLGERNFIGHAQLYRTQIKVPLFFYINGDIKKQVSFPVENIDITPTVLALLNIEGAPRFL